MKNSGIALANIFAFLVFKDGFDFKMIMKEKVGKFLIKIFLWLVTIVTITGNTNYFFMFPIDVSPWLGGLLLNEEPLVYCRRPFFNGPSEQNRKTFSCY